METSKDYEISSASYLTKLSTFVQSCIKVSFGFSPY